MCDVLIIGCSGNGFVDNSSLIPNCVCNPGWTGQADMRFIANQDCDVWIQGQQALWGLTLVMFLFPIFSATFFVVRSIRQRGQSRKVDTNLLFRSKLLLILVCSFYISVAGLKVSDPVKYVIGQNELVTWLFAFANFFLFPLVIFLKGAL